MIFEFRDWNSSLFFEVAGFAPNLLIVGPLGNIRIFGGFGVWGMNFGTQNLITIWASYEQGVCLPLIGPSFANHSPRIRAVGGLATHDISCKSKFTNNHYCQFSDLLLKFDTRHIFSGDSSAESTTHHLLLAGTQSAWLSLTTHHVPVRFRIANRHLRCDFWLRQGLLGLSSTSSC